jgi:hypothetical protein
MRCGCSAALAAGKRDMTGNVDNATNPESASCGEANVVCRLLKIIYGAKDALTDRTQWLCHFEPFCVSAAQPSTIYLLLSKRVAQSRSYSITRDALWAPWLE